MLIRSISRTEAAPSAKATARSRILMASRTRCWWVSRLESSTPAMARVSGGIITAQATTGPAIGPLPTSSTPASKGPFWARRSRSMVVQRFRRGTCLRRGCSEFGFGASGVDWGAPGSTSSCMPFYALGAMRTLGFDAGLCSCLRRSLRTGDSHLGLPLSDAGCLAGEVAQGVQLGATNASTAHDDDLMNHRATNREHAFDADTVGDLS